MIPLLTLVLGSAWAADDAPDEVLAWVDGVEKAYDRHYKTIAPAWEREALSGPPCPRPGEVIPDAPRSSMTAVHRGAFVADPAKAHAACEALRPTGWVLQTKLVPQDQRTFSPLVVRVSRVPKGEKAEDRVAALLDRGAISSRAWQVLIPTGPYLIEVNAPCATAGVFIYDAADAVKMVHDAYPKGAPVSRVAWSACGRQAYAWRDVTEVQQDARQPREYWGIDFPDVRDRVLGRATDDAADAP